MKTMINRNIFADKKIPTATTLLGTGSRIKMELGYSVIIVLSFLVCGLAFGQSDTQMESYTAQCTTKGTNLNGSRNSCDSQKQKVTAPRNYVFSEASLRVIENSGNGSEHVCHYQFVNYVEVIPGSKIMQPKTIMIWAHARSPRHHIGSRGWENCTYKIVQTKYQ